MRYNAVWYGEGQVTFRLGLKDLSQARNSYILKLEASIRQKVWVNFYWNTRRTSRKISALLRLKVFENILLRRLLVKGKKVKLSLCLTN
jgi:hypothetical protein